MPLGSPPKDPEKAGVSARNELQQQNGSSHGRRYGLRVSMRHQNTNPAELRDSLTEHSAPSEDDEAATNRIKNLKKKKSTPAHLGRQEVNTEDEDDQQAVKIAQSRKMKKRGEERKIQQPQEEMDTDDDIKVEVESIEDDEGPRRGTRIRKPNNRFNDYDLASRPKNQITNASLDSADEAPSEANSDSTMDSADDEDERRAQPSTSADTPRRKRGRPRKYPRPEGAEVKRRASPAEDAEEVPRKRLRAADGTFIRRQVKEEIATEDESTQQQQGDRPVRVSFQLPEANDKNEGDSYEYESAVEDGHVVTRARGRLRAEVTPPRRQDRGYATDSELCRSQTEKRGPGRPRKYPLPAPKLPKVAAQVVTASKAQKNSISQTAIASNQLASTSQQKQSVPSKSAPIAPKAHHRKNEVSEKERTQLFGPEYNIEELRKGLPANRKLRSGKEINTEDEATDVDEPVTPSPEGYVSAPESVTRVKPNVVERKGVAIVANKTTNQTAPKLQTSQAQKTTASTDQHKPAKKTSRPQKEKNKETGTVEQPAQIRPTRSCSARSSKDKTEAKSTTKPFNISTKRNSSESRKESTRSTRGVNEGKRKDKGKGACLDTPSSTDRPSSSESYQDMPTLRRYDRSSVSPGKLGFPASTENSEDEIPLSRLRRRPRRLNLNSVKEEQPDELDEPPILCREIYVTEAMPDIPVVNPTNDDELDLDRTPSLGEPDVPPVLSRISSPLLRSISGSPPKPKEQVKTRLPVHKPSPQKERCQSNNNASNPPRTSKDALAPSKFQKKEEQQKKKSGIEPPPKARQRDPAVQTIKTRNNSKTIALPPVLSQLQSTVQLPDTPESQSTPELFEAQPVEAVVSPRRSPRKSSAVQNKEETNSNEDQANPTDSRRTMRSRKRRQSTPVDFDSKKRKADDELIYAFNPLAKRCTSDPTSSTTDEIPNSSSKSTQSICSSTPVSSSCESVGRIHSRKACTPKKLVEELRDASGEDDAYEDSILREFLKKKPEAYAKVFQTTLKMYKELADRKWRPFLRRNLSYGKAVSDEKIVSKHRIGTDIPPLLYEKKQARGKAVVSRNMRDKATYLSKIHNILLQQDNGAKLMRDKFGINVPKQFSLGTLAKAEILDEKESGKGRQYLYRQLGESEAGSSIPESLIDTIMFTSLRHQILPGKRVGWTQLFLAYEIKGKTKLHAVDGGLFPLWINESNTTTIDLINQKYDPDQYDKLYIVAKVGITQNLASCNIKGHTLRSRHGGGEETSKGACFPKQEEYKIEQTYWGAALFHEPEGAGYHVGSVNIELINRDALHIQKHQQKDFLQGLLNEIRKNNTNPFLVTEVKRRPLSELSSSENEYYTDSDASSRNGNSGRPANIAGGSHKHKSEENGGNDEQDKKRQGTARITSRQLLKVINHHTLNALMGKFKPVNGQYVNDKEMLKLLFGEKILQDNKKMSIINKWMSLGFPNKIKYQFLCHIEPRHGAGDETESSSGSGSSRSGEREYKKCTAIQFKKLNWIATDQIDEPDRCIICGWKFPDMFTLMLHYNLTYPRFAFVFSIRDAMFDDYKSASDVRLVIDVMLEPRFQEINEVLPTAVAAPIRRLSSSRFLITRAVTTGLKLVMRRDNTIFARFLNIPEIVDETAQYVSRYIDTGSGRPMTVSEDVDYVTTKVPNPGYQALYERLLRILQDFIDIDQVTKNFMSTWNRIVLAIGRYNQVVLGPYMEHRLFIDTFWHVLNTDESWCKTFCNQLVEYTDSGALSGEECHDLWQRLYNQEYNPLKDVNSTLHRELIDHVYKKNRTMRRHNKKQKVDNFKKAAPYYRKNPREMNDREIDDMVDYMFWHTKAINKLDGRRLFVADPLDNIPNNNNEHLKKFFRKIEHIDLGEGEIDMYRT